MLIDSENDWREYASCRKVTGAWRLFDLDEDNKITKEQKLEADTICAFCPVRRQCLADALMHDTYGVVRAGVIFDGNGRHTQCPSCRSNTARDSWLCGPCKVKNDAQS